MKNLKRMISAACTAAIAGSVLAANSASVLTASAVQDTRFYSQYNFAANWYSLIQQEKQKFPEKVNGQQCYWNGLSEDSYTTSPCGHGWEGSGTSCHFIRPGFTFYDSQDYEPIVEYDRHGQPMTYGQCAGFAAKLQEDIFQTSCIVRFTLDADGKYTTPDGTKHLYVPKNGDAVRIGGRHSIFITNANPSGHTFAQCNADGHCGIDWDATQYSGVTITTAALRQSATYFERPVLVGDLDLDGYVDNADAVIFANTVMKNGHHVGHAPASAYDTNYDGYINEDDYSKLQHMSSSSFTSMKYVNDRRGSVDSRWNYVYEEDGDFLYNGGIYTTRCNTTSGYSFIGVMDRELTSFSVPEYVTNPTDGHTAAVREIGYTSRRAPNTIWINKLQSITIPKTVQKIGEKAFYNTDLRSITFAANSQLSEIEPYAFFSTDLENVTLPPRIWTIGEGAFDSCTSLNSVTVSANAQNLCYLRDVGNNAFRGCTALNNVRISNSANFIEFGTTAGVFDPNASLTLYLPNNTSGAGYLDLQTADAAKFRNNSLRIYAGNYVINEYNGSTFVKRLVKKTATSLTRVYPS